ncbi:MAG: hypothetical protein ACTHQQ_11980 [Solirubrobacteraceae bacterium]
MSKPPTLRLRPTPPLLNARVITTVTEELLTIASCLQTASASARGVAGVERLLTYASSPLYGLQVEPLREELLRLRNLLGE